MPGSDTTRPPPSGSKSAAISNMTVRLLSQYTGRGPTKARAYLQDDLVTVVLQDTLTKGEQTLVDKDRRELVLTTRATFQEVMGEDLIAGIETITGRKVIAFASCVDPEANVAFENFVLEPRESDAESNNASGG